ncbi:MAG: hypothetical protein HYZ50_06165 [Deltaproteobacteria bacterium]|nr:hypothetical protein [Deltaproteobacteria bacterium]
MVTLSQQLSHPFNQGWALHCAAWHARLLRRDADVQHYAQAEATLAHEQGFPTWEAGSTIFLAWEQLAQGQEQEGIASMRQGLEAWRTTYVRAAQT